MEQADPAQGRLFLLCVKGESGVETVEAVDVHTRPGDVPGRVVKRDGAIPIPEWNDLAEGRPRKETPVRWSVAI